MEEPSDDNEFPVQSAVVYINSSHKRIFLRIINAERNFIQNPELYPQFVGMMAMELDAVGEVAFERDESDWLQIMKAWINSVKEDYQTYLRSNTQETCLSNEDEELIANLQENRVSMEPTPEQIKCAIEHLESETIASKLWTTIASDLDEMNGEPKRSISFWKRTFKRIIKRLTAKRELFEHIKQNYSMMKYSNCTLKPLEERLLRAWMQSKLMNTANTEWTETSNGFGSFVTLQIQRLSSNCRICLASTSSKMTHLFGDDARDRITLLDKLNYCSCLSSRAHIGDGFPQFICMSCSVLLESAYQLKLLCAKTEEKLNELHRPGSEKKSRRNKPERTRPMNDETNDEMSDDYIIEEIDVKPPEETNMDAENDMAQTSHIEIEIINELPAPMEACTQLKYENRLSDPLERSDGCEMTARQTETCVVRTKRMYQCQYCNKICKAKNVLTVHMRTHTGERPYICETCGKGFKTSGALGTHRPVHSSEKSFICQHCPYRANTKNNMKIHDRVHSGAQPYKCRFCAVKFSTNSNMQKHMRNIHEKEKTNKCDGCDRSFFSRESARKHMVTHTGLKPYKCTHCSMAYSWYNGLKKHVKAQHANVKIPTETSFYNQLRNGVEGCISGIEI